MRAFGEAWRKFDTIGQPIATPIEPAFFRSHRASVSVAVLVEWMSVWLDDYEPSTTEA